MTLCFLGIHSWESFNVGSVFWMYKGDSDAHYQKRTYSCIRCGRSKSRNIPV